MSYFVEHDDGDARSAGESSRGRVSVDAVWPRLRRPFDATLLHLGAAADAARASAQDLRARDISPEAIHIDAWE